MTRRERRDPERPGPARNLLGRYVHVYIYIYIYILSIHIYIYICVFASAGTFAEPNKSSPTVSITGPGLSTMRNMRSDAFDLTTQAHVLIPSSSQMLAGSPRTKRPGQSFEACKSHQRVDVGESTVEGFQEAHVKQTCLSRHVT